MQSGHPDHQAVIGFCREHAIDLVVVGPEAPLVAGLVDDLEAAGIKAFGPSRAAAQLEGSKAFTKGVVCDEAIFRPPDTAALIRQMPRSPLSGKKVHRLS